MITFAPFFGEYKNYVNNFDGEFIVVSPDTETFQPNLWNFRSKITAKTKAVIVNTPNNPTGVVYSEGTIIKWHLFLNEKQKEFKTSIYLISDEPYRELVYDGVNVPYLTKYYNNTIVGIFLIVNPYPYQVSSIGYLVIPDEVTDSEDIIAAANVANSILGFVNAPSLIQSAVAKVYGFRRLMYPYIIKTENYYIIV